MINQGVVDKINSLLPGNIEMKIGNLLWMAFGRTQTLTDSATIAWNLLAGNVAQVTLEGNRVMGAPTSLDAGMRYTLICIQDSTGNRTLDLSDSIFKFPSGTEPTLSTGAGAIDIIQFISYDGTYLYGVADLNFS